MSTARPSVDEIFDQAILRSPGKDRTAYLDEACGGDSDLRQRVERLLRAFIEAGSFLESPAADIAATTDSQSLAERPGTTIGPYKLLQQIGEGGMGVVFMAEQSAPIQRTVALKVIKPGMDTRQVIARIEAERQALALMDHPNIAKVLDAGTTDSGRPYFVMELVKGVPITQYCDEKHLSLRERLELLLPVCQAVQHAHQKGIIHRDIKPTNVLVAEYDNHAVPKVIDFGVAKATAQRLTERTIFTEFGQMIGTVDYMSPEQAKLNQLDIDTRSDIYSLGVLLYELLTGSTPFEQKRLREAAFDEVLRIIREEEPPKPSTKLSSSDTLPSIAANRHTEPARLTKEVRGELDWIVMKALDKERNRRYETASGLAHDIERYLTDQPLQAGPPALGYKLRKYLKRNKRGVAIAALLSLVIMGAIAGTAGSIGWAVRDRQARADFLERNVVRALEAAEAALNRGDVTQVTNSMNEAEGIISASEPRQEVLDRLRHDQSRLRKMLFDVQLSNDFYNIQSNPNFLKAEEELKLREAIRRLPETSQIYALLSGNLALQGKLADAEVNAQKAVQLDPNDAWAHHCLALVLARRKKFDEAISHLRSSLQLQKDVGDTPSVDFEQWIRKQRVANQLLYSDRGQSQIELAWALRQAGRATEAEQLFQEVRKDQYFGNLANAADYFAKQGRFLEAATHYLEISRANPIDADAALRAAYLQLVIGDREQYEAVCQRMLERFRETKDSDAAYRTCFACLVSPRPVGDLEQLTQLSKAGDGVPPDLFCRARALVAYRAGNWQESLQWCGNSRKASSQSNLMIIPVLESMALQRLGRSDEASQAYEESTTWARRSFPDAPLYFGYWGAGQNDWFDWISYELLRREAEGLVIKSAATSLLELARGSADSVRAGVERARSLSWSQMDSRDLLTCGELLLLGDEFEKAAAAIAEAIKRGGNESPNRKSTYDFAYSKSSYYKSLGWALLRAGRKDEAAAALTDAIEGLDHDKLVSKGEPDHWTAAYLLGRVSAVDYVNHWRAQAERGRHFRHLPWFYIGQKMEAEGDLKKAAAAYRQSVEECADFNEKAFIMKSWTGTVEELITLFSAKPIREYSERSAAWAAYRLSVLLELQPTDAQASRPASQRAELTRYVDVFAPHETAIEFRPNNPAAHNAYAWLLATAPEPENRDPSRAVELATRAVKLAPTEGSFWNTLGAAQYRAGNWNGAIQALNKSLELRVGGDVNDWFFLAMAHQRLGRNDQARKWYDQAVDWIEKYEPRNTELGRLRAEAAGLLRVR